MKRRQFIKRMAQTAAALSATSALSADRVTGANERVRVGLIGCGGRGMNVAKLMRDMPDVDFVAVCDLYPPHLARAKEWAGSSAKEFKDFRRLLEQKDLDAVLIATPDHWHAIPTVLACQAGKDVYVEKPLADTIASFRWAHSNVPRRITPRWRASFGGANWVRCILSASGITRICFPMGSAVRLTPSRPEASIGTCISVRHPAFASTRIVSSTRIAGSGTTAAVWSTISAFIASTACTR